MTQVYQALGVTLVEVAYPDLLVRLAAQELLALKVIQGLPDCKEKLARLAHQDPQEFLVLSERVEQQDQLEQPVVLVKRDLQEAQVLRVP